ncbi:hypothetical protein E6C70_08770 [Glaciibacter flavus]|uniref:YCII-related domain-containing protein n=1 Tax=Orlajensenia flava TaxID=2565934 RepID=A0A4S4FWN7_9MICO|nr:YciI family protein [Glaciibacter flavus]THG34355.1 hypothetical protein E6C70_08770 [Glaciibacter flavus]
MPKYLILVFRDEQVEQAGFGEAVSPDYLAFMDRRAGALLGGAALEPTSSATSVRADGSGGFVITDGPFAESKEALGGYYLIEAADLDEALAIAKEVPAPRGGVEVRPVWAVS